ncbi:MAG: permease [Bacteroidales bacterium]|nr:permease [Bacteroidales bacterium]
MKDFLLSLLTVMNAMSPYLLLGFLVAGVLHVFVPKKFYRRYLTNNDFRSVLCASLLGIPLPLCSCGVIPTAVGLRNEKASKGAVAAFLIATPQTGIDSILATFSLMGLGFAIVRPSAALVTGIVGGILVNRLLKNHLSEDYEQVKTTIASESAENKLIQIFRYAYVNMIQDIGPRLLLGLLLAAVIQVAIPDEFFLQFSNRPLVQMLVMLAVAVPMYVCSTGSIPIAAALLAKGLTPGAAFVLLMAGPAVNFGSILVINKTMGRKFTSLYLITIILGAIIFGFLLNNTDSLLHFTNVSMEHCCQVPETTYTFPVFKTGCSVLLLLLILNAFVMKLFERFRKKNVSSESKVYVVEGMHCNHCKASVENAVRNVKGVTSVDVNLEQQTVTVEGTASSDKIEKAVTSCGFEFKGERE